MLKRVSARTVLQIVPVVPPSPSVPLARHKTTSISINYAIKHVSLVIMETITQLFARSAPMTVILVSKMGLVCLATQLLISDSWTVNLHDVFLCLATMTPQSL